MSDLPALRALHRLDRAIHPPEEFRQRLLAALETELDRLPGGVRVSSAASGRRPGRPTRFGRGIAVAAQAAVTVILLGTAVGMLTQGPPIDQTSPTTTRPADMTSTTATVSTSTTRARDESPAVSLTSMPPGWASLDPGPVAAVAARASTWTGSELVVWAGESAAYDPATGTWRDLGRPTVPWSEGAMIVGTNGRIAAVSIDADVSILRDVWSTVAPRPDRVRHLVDAEWVGDVLYVVAHVQNQARLGDELVLVGYDPEEGRWSEFAQPPVRLSYGDLSWTGEELFLYGGFLDANNRPRSEDGYASGARYDPAADTWELLEAHPLSPNSVTSVWADDRLIAWDYNQDAAEYLPDRGWIDLPEPPLPSGECHVSAAWTGEQFVAWYCGLAAMYEPLGGVWQSILTPTEAALFAPDALVAGSPVAGSGGVYFWGSPYNDDWMQFWRLDPDAVAPAESIGSVGGWSLLPPTAIDGRPGAATVWTGDQLIVWGGEVPAFSERPDEGWPLTNEGGAYDPRRDSWYRIPASPLSPRRDAAAVWTGSEMLIVGGGPGGAAYDPVTGAWDPLPPHPVPTDGASIWSGSEIILWGGVTGFGSAFAPESDTWRDLADSPLSPRTGHTSVWTGSEMIIWGGWVASSGGLYEIEAAQNGAAYDPATDSWRMLPDLPDDLQLSHHTAVWTGSEMIIWGANFEARDRSGSQDGIPRLAGASYDPATGRWRTIASPPFATVEQIEFFGAHSSVWTGTRMVVWAGGGFVSASGPELWLYEPKSDMWERGAPAPLDAADPVLVWADGRVYAYGGADFGQLRRTLAIDLGPEGATVPPFPGDNSPVDIGEPVPFRVLALEIDDREVVAATEIDLNAGIRTTFDSDDLAAPLETVTGVLPLRRGWLTISNESVMAFPDGLYRPPIVVADFAGRDDAITAATIPTLDGEERLWLVVAEPGRTTARFIRGFQYPVTLEIGLPSAAQPVAAAGNRLLVNLPNDAGQTDVAVIETGGRVERLTEGVGLGLVASRVVWLDCAQACSIRVSSVVAGPGDHDVIISPQNGWAFAAPLPQSGRSVVAPNGRHVVLPYHRSGDEGEPAMVLVDLSTGTLEPIRDGVAGNVRGGPGVTWSSDSTWVLLSGGSLGVAINVVDGRRVDLSGLLPDGATVAATAPIG